VSPKLQWIQPDLCEDEVAKRLSSSLAARELAVPGSFPDLRADSHLVIACDYSGEHKAADFQVLTFLLADRPSVLGAWEHERLRVRQEYLADGRRLAFKDLSDRQRQRALGPFLVASGRMNGIVMSVAVEKSLASSRFGYHFAEFADVKPLVLAKLLRIAVCGSVLVGGLSANAQNLLWITDDDEVVSNERMRTATQTVVTALLRRCCPHHLGSVDFGIASAFDDGRRAEDLCAIPDLVGGAVAEIMNPLRDSMPHSAALFAPFTAQTSTKTDVILSWLATLRGPLKHLVCAVKPVGDSFRWSFGTIAACRHAGLTTRLWRPPDKGWRKAIEGWW
jgi:hypothetical protein